MQDRYETFVPGLESPAAHGFPITPDDDEDLPELTRAIYVGTSGTISLVLASGAAIELEGVAGGTVLPLRVARVHITGTTAGALVALI